jgi:hypothetical protein
MGVEHPADRAHKVGDLGDVARLSAVSEVQASNVSWMLRELAGHLQRQWSSVMQFRWDSSCGRKRGAWQSHKRLPYSSIKVSNTSLDHLLLGKAADEMIIRPCLAAGQICLCEPDRLAAIWEPQPEMTVFGNRSVVASEALIHNRSYQSQHGLAFDNP